ncbi:MAG: hypothetical protein ACK5O7_04015 [Holosporales bacterium]
MRKSRQASSSWSVRIENTEDLKTALEQYKLMVDSIEKTNALRENANNFWTTVNALALSIIANTIQNTKEYPKVMLIIIFNILGVGLCFLWISYLFNLKRNIEVRNFMVSEVEKVLPIPYLTYALAKARRLEGHNSLTMREIVVPALFMASYFALTIYTLFTL